MSRRRHRGPADVELNLAAMLDMAFQLLTFFILTFKPSPVEGELALNLPQAKRAIVAPTEAAKPENTGQGEAAVPSLIITVYANPNGDVQRLQVNLMTVFNGPATPQNLSLLSFRLEAIIKTGTMFEQVLIRVGEDLRYEELMKIIDTCTKQKLANGEPLTKISFSEIPKGNPGG